MSDPIRHDDLIDHEMLREAAMLEAAITDLIDGGPPRDELVVLIVTARAYLDACEYAELDPWDALAQIADAHDSGLLDNTQDPAGGRFVFQPFPNSRSN